MKKEKKAALALLIKLLKDKKSLRRSLLLQEILKRKLDLF